MTGRIELMTSGGFELHGRAGHRRRGAGA